MRLFEAEVSNPLSVESNGKTLSGPFAIMDKKNQNGRIYPAHIYKEAYSELVPKIKENRLMGELDHPIDYDEVRLANVSHLIKYCDLRENEKGEEEIYGTVELLDTPAGLIAQALVEAGVPLGISSRGVGNTTETSKGTEVTQFKLITYDLVADPSFAEAILTESKKQKLGERLDFIESKISLNESLEGDPIRKTISTIRKSLKKSKEDTPSFQEIEINSLRGLAESYSEHCKKLQAQLKESQESVSKLEELLEECYIRNDKQESRMSSLREAYNERVSSTVEKEKYEALQEQVLELQKKLAVEKRGMSYEKVSQLLEGVSEESEIEEKLNSISRFGRRKIINKDTREPLKESSSINLVPKGLASIVSKV